MADVVRILDLDDDNHAPMFRMETGEIFESPRELIEFLSHSHDVEYQVKMFAIVNNWTGRLEEFEDYEVDQMFCFLEGFGGVTESEPGFIFDLFWESANKEWW
jgi:hypothetical protein